MRRMYSEQELTNVIKTVFEQELEDGALDESVADAVDAYLVEHPVDVTALEGQDVELASLNATGLITGGEIVEKMSGYSYVNNSSSSFSVTNIYSGVAKNGNKVTFVLYFKINFSTLATGYIGTFTIPSAVGSKLYPTTIGGQTNKLQVGLAYCATSFNSGINTGFWIDKISNTSIAFALGSSGLSTGTDYLVRMEATFLLSDNLAPQE